MSDDARDQPAAPQQIGQGQIPPQTAAQAAPVPEAGTSVVAKKRRAPLLIGLVVAVVVIALLYLLYDFFIGSRAVSTDNAYVAGDTAAITPLTSGQIADVLVSDTQPVRKGQILFRIDDADQRVALAQDIASVEYAQRRFGQSLASNNALEAAADASQTQIQAAIAKLASASAELDRTQTEYKHRQALAGSGAVSAEELNTARQAFLSAQAAQGEAKAAVAQAKANLINAQRQHDAGEALTVGADKKTAPEVLLAKAQLANAQLAMQRTVIRAPIDGVVSKRTIQVGQRIDAGTQAMIIVPVGQLYVDANFKEDQLGKVRSGQSATLTSDFYGSGVVYHGKVVGFSGGTGAAFSLIPAQNATGNWIKVVQRLPVRIELDPKELQEHPLRIGLSMDAKIDLTSKN